jgi:indole-3-acetate monooxygenase
MDHHHRHELKGCHRSGEAEVSVMTGTLSTQETSQTPWEPDTSLLDAAREIAPIVREQNKQQFTISRHASPRGGFLFHA